MLADATLSLLVHGLKLDHDAFQLSAQYYSAFRVWQSAKPCLVSLNKEMLAAACVFLAAKVTESPRRLRDVVNVLSSLVDPDAEYTASDERYWWLRDAIVNLELLLLRVSDYDIKQRETTAYSFFLHYCTVLLSDVEQAEAVRNLGWILMNDTLVETSTQHKPAITAIGALYLSMKLLNVDPPPDLSNDSWWLYFGFSTTDLTNVCKAMAQSLLRCAP